MNYFIKVNLDQTAVPIMLLLAIRCAITLIISMQSSKMLLFKKSVLTWQTRHVYSNHVLSYSKYGLSEWLNAVLCRAMPCYVVRYQNEKEKIRQCESSTLCKYDNKNGNLFVLGQQRFDGVL